MNKTIREASTRLLGLLPSDVLHYNLDDLRRFGMPEFITRRIQLDLVDALTRSITPPTTEWVDMSRHRSVVIWNHFVETISADVHLPRNRAADVIDHAVIETVEIITTPRRRMIEVLFGMSQELTLNELRIRSRGITVHRHIPESLMRYMELKELHTITRTAATDLVRKVDDRYCATFTPLSWAQSLDPLYQLAGSRVDADLIRDYFIDKDLEHYAVRFENLPHRVERSQLIEILSISDLDNLILDDDRQSAPIKKDVEADDEVIQKPIETNTIASAAPAQTSLFEKLSEIHVHDKNGYGSESETTITKKVKDTPVESNLNADFASNSDKSEEGDSLLNDIQYDSESETRTDSPSVNTSIVKNVDSSEIKNQIESLIEDDTDIEEVDVQEELADTRIIDMLVQPELPKQEEEPVDDDFNDTVNESSNESSLNDRLNTASVIPIWQRFLEDVPEVSDDVDDHSVSIADSHTLSEMEMTDGSDEITLLEWLKPDEKDYIETLFDGDKEAYDNAIDDLSMYQTWSQAQTYLKKKLMPAVSVDFHDELFINFVDQLQHYFSRLPID